MFEELAKCKIVVTEPVIRLVSSEFGKVRTYSDTIPDEDHMIFKAYMEERDSPFYVASDSDSVTAVNAKSPARQIVFHKGSDLLIAPSNLSDDEAYVALRMAGSFGHWPTVRLASAISDKDLCTLIKVLIEDVYEGADGQLPHGFIKDQAGKLSPIPAELNEKWRKDGKGWSADKIKVKCPPQYEALHAFLKKMREAQACRNE